MDSQASRLYKYLHPDLVVVLENRSFRFTQASCFNDPFELFPTLDAYLRPLMTAFLLKQLKAAHRSRMLAAMEELLGDQARLLGLPAHLDEELQDDDSELNRSLRKAVRQAIRNQKASPAQQREILATTRAHLNERFGVLCLAETPDNLLMWSHYADSHRGFVLELDAGDPFFDQRKFPADPLRCLRKVRYQTERPAPAWFDEKYWLRSPSTASEDLLTHMAGLLLLTKSCDWTYEQEWRMLLPLSQATKTIPRKEGDIHLFAFPPRCLRGVVLGSAMSEQTRRRIIEILEHPDYRHVDLRRAERDSRRFRLVVRDDKSMLENKLLEDLGAFPRDGVQQRIVRLGAGSPRFYEAMRSLSDQGLLLAPPFDRSKQKKRLLTLTPAGKARLAARQEAARVQEEHGQSPVSRFVEAAMASPERVEELFASYLAESLGEPEPGPLQGLDVPEILSSFAALGDDDEDVRWKAACSLREIGDAETVEPLIAILRADTYEELIWLQDPRQAGDLTADEIDAIEIEAPLAYWALADKTAWGSEEIKRLAAHALAGILARVTADEAVEPLIESLREPDPDIRWPVVEALGHLGSPRALPHLERLAQDDADSSWGAVAAAARTAIQRIRKAQERVRLWD